MPLARLFPRVIDQLAPNTNCAPYHEMYSRYVQRLGEESNPKDILAIFGTAPDAAELSGALDEHVPNVINIIAQAPEAAQTPHICVASQALWGPDGILISAGKTRRLRLEEVGSGEHARAVRDKVLELKLAEKENAFDVRVIHVIVQGPTGVFPTSKGASRLASACGVAAGLGSVADGEIEKYLKSRTYPLSVDACCSVGEELDHCRIILIAMGRTRDSSIPQNYLHEHPTFGATYFELPAYLLETPERLWGLIEPKIYAAITRTVDRPRCYLVYGFFKGSTALGACLYQPNLGSLSTVGRVLRYLDDDDRKYLNFLNEGYEGQCGDVACLIFAFRQEADADEQQAAVVEEVVDGAAVKEAQAALVEEELAQDDGEGSLARARRCSACAVQ